LLTYRGVGARYDAGLAGAARRRADREPARGADRRGGRDRPGVRGGRARGGGDGDRRGSTGKKGCRGCGGECAGGGGCSGRSTGGPCLRRAATSSGARTRGESQSAHASVRGAVSQIQ